MRRKQKILVYSTQFMPTGGIESHLQEFCTHLTGSDISIDLVIPHVQMMPETRALFERCCARVFFGNHKSAKNRFFYLLYVGVRLLFSNYVSLYTNGQGESIQFFSRLCRFRNWVHHHHMSGDAADQATWGKQYIKVLKGADTLIACSRTNAASMALFLQRKVDVIACFSKQLFVKRKKNRLPNAKLAFGYYGRLIPEKGIETLCALSKEPQLAAITFHIWGKGEAYDASYFSQYPNVVYHGAFAGKEQLTEVVAQLDAFLLLSVHPEGLPISLLEVMSAGLPWLATDKGGVPDIACDPIATRVIPANSTYETIKEAVGKLATDLQAGLINQNTEIKLYEENFSAGVLTGRWKTVLHV